MRLWKNPFLLVGILPWLTFFFLSVASSEILSGSGIATDPIPDPNPKWETLTRKDFSSQIRLNSHILILVTVPWCGESRSLMREIKHLVSVKREEFGHLKLFVVYRNSEKILAEMLGATEGIKIVYYQNSIQLKYNGRLRALNILSSISHTMSIHDDEIPLKPISEFNEIERSLDLTEKSVLLIDLCGWSALLAPKITNGSYDTSSLSNQSNKVASGVLVKEAYRTVELSDTQDKIIEDEEIAYRGYAASSAWESGFTLANQSVPEETQNGEFYNKPTCTIEEFQKFRSFYKEFISLAKEHFLPPERQRFSLVSSKSLLPYLGIENVENWSVLVRFSGCPNCSIILRDGDELKSVLLDHHPLVKELDTEALFPSNMPSLVLFIDTSAESSETRSESKLALDVIRKYAGPNHKLLVRSRVSSSKRTVSRDASDSNVMNMKDKMLMIVNEVSEGNNNRLVDILTKLLQQSKTNRQKSKEKKISVVAKELGFQLLSQDFDVKEVKPTLEDKSDSQSDDVTSEKEINVPIEDLDAKSEEETIPKSDILEYNKEALYENEFEKNFEMEVEIKKRKEQILSEMEQEKTTSDKKFEYISEIEEIASISSMQTHEVKKELSDDNTGFVGSIFFADGSYQLLNSLTSGSRVPTLIIIDPIKQQHFVFDEDTLICDSSLVNFLERFLNQSLPPFIRSDAIVSGTKEFPRPPFVNQDFHEAVSVPRISANGFCESVMGYKDCLVIDKGIDLGNVNEAWSRDVLVLFSNSWCGFCQRMELVLREVYRAFDSFMTVSSERDANIIENQDKSEMSPTDLPLIYLMDCTQNDCYPFLRSSGKEELYPTLLLFPAETKKSISFDSVMSVINIFEFLDAHSKNFKNYRGTLWTQPRETIQDKSELQDISSAIEEHRISQLDLEIGIPTIKPDNSRYNIEVGYTLSASDHLTDPFDNSTILIVSADPEAGFKGLIINKPMNWNIFKPDALVDSVKAAPISYGGPVAIQGFPLVSLSNKVTDGYVKVIDGVYFGDTVATNMVFKRIHNGTEAVDGFWFFFGFSSWLYEQLFNELDQGAWQLSKSTAERLDWPDR
ncbi:hypothetical protein LUZ61_019331 [Rhynchospora tenuis]|uniref:Thioredoxin domain-containing protein n=1 Tax=Rhynchospora tenuis TaxID=198213 RepID=A0AAD6EMS4_9POAL|nr:hypothetical protein LUZ61_019331 [Rhynchospora tenuis]